MYTVQRSTLLTYCEFCASNIPSCKLSCLIPGYSSTSEFRQLSKRPSPRKMLCEYSNSEHPLSIHISILASQIFIDFKGHFLFCLETRFLYVIQADLKLSVILP